MLSAVHAVTDAARVSADPETSNPPAIASVMTVVPRHNSNI
jgi:hypothetical protein